MKTIARSYFWWPGMAKQIESMAQNCQNCVENRNNPPKIPLQVWKWPNNPWERIHIDYMGPIFGKYFLIVLDAHSKWLEVILTNKITAHMTIDILRQLIARFGLFDLLVSDNAPAFKSIEFQKFLKLNSIKHITSAPYHPASNGAAENAVKTAKNALKNALGRTGMQCQNPNLNLVLSNFLFDYRSTPHTTTKSSPAFLMFGRHLKTRFDEMNPFGRIEQDKLNTRTHVVKMQNKQSKNYSGKRNVDFKLGDLVYFRNYADTRHYVRGKIVKRLGMCNYQIDTGEKTVTRHANQILKRNIISIPITTNNTVCEPAQSDNNVDFDVQQNLNSEESPRSASSPEPQISNPSNVNIGEKSKKVIVANKALREQPQRVVKKPVRYGIDE